MTPLRRELAALEVPTVGADTERPVTYEEVEGEPGSSSEAGKGPKASGEPVNAHRNIRRTVVKENITGKAEADKEAEKEPGAGRESLDNHQPAGDRVHQVEMPSGAATGKTVYEPTQAEDVVDQGNLEAIIRCQGFIGQKVEGEIKGRKNVWFPDRDEALEGADQPTVGKNKKAGASRTRSP